MANPEIVVCPAGQWTLVAEDVTTGYIWPKKKDPNLYKQTYRDTGEDAPDNDDDAIPMPKDGIAISSTTSIDVYIKAVGKAGSVRVDIP